MDTDVPPILLPCAICARTFMPQSLEKHSRVCERTATKRRKPFDSAKQRIQGTDLAEFLPKQEKKRHYIDERVSKPKTSWKQNHDDFLQAIRAARNEIVEPPGQRQCRSVTSGAPTRSNEQGMCPTCNRYFGIKAYDRHVTWCKERSTRVVLSPATNVAKERLEARMKYRAPTLKTRRAINREKYSPGSATILSSKTSPVLSSTKAKESVSTPSCNRSNDTLIKQKPGVVRRLGEAKETSSPTGPMKSRLADRMDSGTLKDYNPFLLAEQQMNDLLSDTSEPSVTDNPAIKNTDTLFPLSPSSAFVKYPYHTSSTTAGKRTSLIAPPSEFDDLTSDFSSDSTETNSLSREVFLKDLKENKEFKDSLSKSVEEKSPTRELGRRVIIDKSKALGGEVGGDYGNRNNKTFINNSEKSRKVLGKVSPKIVRPAVNRSLSVRAASAPKPTGCIVE